MTKHNIIRVLIILIPAFLSEAIRQFVPEPWNVHLLQGLMSGFMCLSSLLIQDMFEYKDEEK